MSHYSIVDPNTKLERQKNAQSAKNTAESDMGPWGILYRYQYFPGYSNTSSSKYFPYLQTILSNLPMNTSQHVWIVINTSES